MNQREINKRQEAMWISASLAVPLVHTASGCSWVAVAIMGALVLLIRWCTMEYLEPAGPVLHRLQTIWICLLISEALYWSGESWPGERSEIAVPLILLALAVWTVWRGSARVVQIGCVLLWPILGILVTVLLSGLPEVRMENLKAELRAGNGSMIPLLFLFTVKGEGEKKKRIKPLVLLVGLAIAAAAIVGGALDNRVSTSMPAPFYEMSRSLSLLGTVERFESLAGSVMAVGNYLALGFLLAQLGCQGKMLILAGIAGLLFVAKIRIDSSILAAGSIVFWAIVPSLQCLGKIIQKK